MNYQETIDFLYSQLPIFQREGASAYRADLGNIVALTEFLGNPHQSFKSIHIAGTNGKGSTSHVLTSVAMEAGLTVGTYTSPHYLDFRERIRVNGQYISENAVVEFVNQIKPMIDELRPSFFEITVAMAFWYFKEKNVDIAIIEVGLGGRLDSTNIISPILSIITNISLDHQQFLGNTKELIAVEKAGIIKPNTPVVIGKTQKETEYVFRKIAIDQNTSIVFADQDYQIEFIDQDDLMQEFNLKSTETGRSINIKTDLLGKYQQENIRTSYVAVEQTLNVVSWTEQDFLEGVAHVQDNSQVFGRWQILQKNPTVIADSSHNVDGIANFLSDVRQLDYDELFVIYGAANDKDVDEIIPYIPLEANIMLTQASVPRAMPVDQLKNYFNEFSQVETEDNPQFAYEQVLKKAKANDLILIFGSIFLIGDVLKSY